MTTFLSSWQDFKSVVEGTSRKLLKKTCFPLAIKQLAFISAQMQDEELSYHAVVCHSEQAHIQRKMNNSDEERKQYVIAANILYNLLYRRVNSRSRAHCYSRKEITVFYSRSISLCMEMRDLRVAGFTSLEAAKVLTDCVQSDMAAEHAQRAVRLLEGDFNALLQSLYCLATVHFHLSLWEHLLADVDDIWMVIMKCKSRSSMGRRVLKDLEVITVLILWRTQLSCSGRHKLLMSLYADSLGFHMRRKSLFPKVGTEEACWAFIESAGNIDRAAELILDGQGFCSIMDLRLPRLAHGSLSGRKTT
uniref:Protein ZIP4 homolog n=1 Tax=Haemonchus contortus TaxID=6289 RepID=A0A7I4Z5F9_HAECO